MWRHEIINRFIDAYNYTSYLEIGVWNAENFLKVLCKNKECVDPLILNYETVGNKDIIIYNESEKFIFDYIEKNILTYKTTTDDLFENILEENKYYDFIFIDGDHREEQVDKDIRNSLKHLTEGGRIMLHDSLPWDELCGSDIRQENMWMGTVWKSIVKLNSLYEGLKYHVIDTDNGCCIIEKLKNFKEKKNPYTEDMQYGWVFYNETIKNAALNIISVEEFENMLENKEI
jgi:hypothetical protein